MSFSRTEIKPSGTFSGGEIWCENSIMASQRLYQQICFLGDVVSSGGAFSVGRSPGQESQDQVLCQEKHFSELSNFLKEEIRKLKGPTETI